MAMIAVEQERLEDVIAESAAERSPGKRRLFGLLPPKVEPFQATAIDDLIEEKMESMGEDVDDLDKAWDVILHALNDLHKSGAAPESANLAISGERSETGGPMGGYGWSSAEEVVRIAKGLSSVELKAFSEAVLRLPETAYLGELIGEEGSEYFDENFVRLCKFYERAANNQHAVMMVAT